MKHRWYAVLGVLGLLLWACSGPVGRLGLESVEEGEGVNERRLQSSIYTSLSDGTKEQIPSCAT